MGSSATSRRAAGVWIVAFATLIASGAAQILPRQSNIRDLGYSDRPRGWYDAQCQGADNDYCRWVGDAPNIFWSCALAGATSEYTPGGIFTPETTTNTTTCPTGVKPKPARILTDWGYGDRTRGWYDVQCQGARNDYCRWVGDAPNTWWSCALAGATNQYSPSGAFTQENTRTTVCAAGLKPRRSDITDWGYGDRTRGWYDAQCQGARNDYCRYVGDAPNVFWSCALAGRADQYTQPGLYTEATTSVQPCGGPGIKSRQVGITDRGNMDRTRGWYDAQCQGAANDYCRYVGDAPNVWWSCALAGSNNEYSPAGLFTEAGMRRVPC